MPDISIFPIPAFVDNYIWCLTDEVNAVIVDPGQAEPVLDHLSHQDLTLTHILVTHHHPDHVGGIAALKAKFPDIEILGYEQAHYSGLSHTLKAEEELELFGHRFTMIPVPGHTLDHVAFICSDLDAVFPGDTIFSAGCGRLFEGTPHQMYTSLQRLQQLPDDTKIYCTHEYTLANLEFALSLMPSNPALVEYAKWCEEVRQKEQPTLPSTLALEKQINPFLRQNDPELIASLRELNYKDLNNSEQIFAATRDAKDKH